MVDECTVCVAAVNHPWFGYQKPVTEFQESSGLRRQGQRGQVLGVRAHAPKVTQMVSPDLSIGPFDLWIDIVYAVSLQRGSLCYNGQTFIIVLVQFIELQ